MEVVDILMIPEQMIDLLEIFSIVLGIIMAIFIFLVADVIHKWNPDRLRSRLFLKYDLVRHYTYWIGIWAILVSTVSAIWILTRSLRGYYFLSVIGFQLSVIFASLYIFLLFKKKIS